jgi:two-component system LytT family sensor kinase
MNPYNQTMDMNTIFSQRKYQFWALQFGGWSGWGVSFFIGQLFWDNPDVSRYYVYLPIVCTIGLIFSLGLRLLYKYMWEMPLFSRLVGLLLGSYCAAVAWMGSRHLIFKPLFGKKTDQVSEHGNTFFSFFDGATSAWWVMLCWSGLYFGIKYYQLLSEEREQTLKITAMAHEAQLKMLRYQLNPHFLFNTLNAISTLILDKDNELANTMVTRLSHFLRYSLDNDPMQTVNLAQEIDALRLYLDIEKVRFDERLRLDVNIEAEARQALIPSLILQPLVENAIKFAISQAINGGTIRIEARVFAGDLLIEVADDGPGIDTFNHKPTTGSGVGLVNTKERLRELYGSKQSFTMTKTEPHGVTINIRLPFEVDESKTT